jgi:gamma-glutamylcyclotransferase (GGCT)/AIG2-like uncharacterized protein YtfP
MLDFFVYGTLLDDDVRALVLGRGGPAESPTPATLAGFRRVPVMGHSFPALIADPRGRVEGALIAGVGIAEAARLSYFEGPEYQALRRPVERADGSAGDAWLFVPAPRQPFMPGLRPRLGSWDLATWQRRHKARYLPGLRRTMDAAPAPLLAELRQAWQERMRQPANSRAGQPAKSNAPRPGGAGRVRRN